ncbi:MAG: hypothetical protein CM15mP45_08020 [Deltaproteobacteria bacterium]|nr:MAG: hypothetical protein CM15mP45_08020 [Deltaproteobacteria bacterium]
MLEQYSDNSSVVAVPIKVPASLKDSDLPGRATFGDVSVRHFAVKDNSSIPSTSDYYGAPLLKTDFSSFASTAFPNGQSDVDTLVGKGFETLKSETDNFSKIEKLKAYWQLARGLSQGMPLVSMEAVGLVADNDNKTVTLKELAKQMASITEWQQERISFANNIPIFTGNFVAPSTGKTVKANDLITALTRKIGTDAKSTGKSFTDDNEYFWAPFAAHALKEQIIRNASAVSSDGNEMLKLIPDNKSGYRELLIGGEFTGSSGDKKKVPPSPAFMEARSKVARGLAAALPAGAYSTSSETKTLNGETELDAKGSTFLITYMLELEYPISKQKGLFSTESGGPNTLVFPNIENFKSLNFTSNMTVGEISAKVFGVTAPTDNDSFSYAASALRSAESDYTSLLGGLSSYILPEFKTFTASDLGVSQQSSVSISCPVTWYNNTTDFSEVSASLLLDTGGEFSDSGISIDDTSTAGTFVATIPSSGFNKSYAVKLSVSSYRNDLPKTFFYVDGYEANMGVCGPDGFVIGPDVEDKPVPGMGLFAATSASSAEGLDFSNFTEPGKLFLLFPNDVSSGQGTKDLMLIQSGNSFSLETGGNVTLAVIKDTSGTANFTGTDDRKGIHSLLGSSLSSLVSSYSSSLTSLSLSPDSNGGLSEKLVMLKVSDKEYWIVELRFIDTNMGMLDLGFASINSKGRAEIPDAGFEKQQGPIDATKEAGIARTMLFFGDGVNLSDGSMQFPLGFDGTANSNIDTVTLRYAGDFFEENISSFDDMNTYFQDASSIPVRLDARGSNTFMKLSFKKQSRSYVLDNESATYEGNLNHGDIIGVCSGDWQGSSCPEYIVRVVKNAPPGDLMANLQIELETIKFSESASDPRMNVLGESDASDASKYPKYSVSGNSAGIVYDGDYDGVPYIFDPNDSDPNIPGSGAGPMMAGGGGQPEQFGGQGVSVALVNQYTYSEEGKTAKQSGGSTVAPSRRLMVRADGLYPGDIDTFKLSQTNLSLSNNIFLVHPQTHELWSDQW